MKQFVLKVFLVLLLVPVTLNLFAQTEDPSATVGGLKNGSVKRADLMAVEKIVPNSSTIAIVSFTISYPVGTDDLIELVSKSDKITQEMKDHFKTVKSGTEISFENIKAKMADKTVILESVILKLTD
jgi:hypothetical protein